MRFVRCDDVSAFYARVLPVLEKHEAQNNLMIGILERGARLGGTEEWLMATVEEESGSIALVVLMTPPQNLLLAGASDDGVARQALDALMDALHAQAIAFPGVLAEKSLVRAFEDRYAQRFGGAFAVEMEERVYQLTQVSPVRLVGSIREVTTQDMHYVPYWLTGFHDDAFGGRHDIDAEGAQSRIERGGLYVLEVDGMPVCLAGAARRTPHGRSIGPVYTPPYLRGRGYATSCVAQLSQLLLSEGNDYCALFTDLSNPASNGAYMKVGYQPVADFTQLRYDADAR